jgi:hypothetical protein
LDDIYKEECVAEKLEDFKDIVKRFQHEKIEGLGKVKGSALGIFLFFMQQCSGIGASTFYTIYLAESWFDEDSLPFLRFC